MLSPEQSHKEIQAVLRFKAAQDASWDQDAISSPHARLVDMTRYDVRSGEWDDLSSHVLNAPRQLQRASLRQPIERLKSEYEFRDSAAVENLISHYQAVVPILAGAPSQIRQYFGNHAKRLCLSVFCESDTPVGSVLFITIVTDLKFKDAQQCLDDLDSAWFLSQYAATQGKLNITIEHN